MTKNRLKVLIITIALMFVQAVYADTEAELLLGTEVPLSATIEKTVTNESDTVNVTNGSHGGLLSVFTLQTTGTDEDFDFIITASIETDNGTVSAYGADRRILFGNLANKPTAADVANAMTSSGKNENVIAYYSNVEASGVMMSNFVPNNGIYGNSYAIKVNNSEGGNITHRINGTPVANTYSMAQDSAGMYQVTVTFTAYSK